MEFIQCVGLIVIDITPSFQSSYEKIYFPEIGHFHFHFIYGNGISKALTTSLPSLSMKSHRSDLYSMPLRFLA